MSVLQQGVIVHAWPQDMRLAVDALGSDQAMTLISVPTPDTTSRALARERIRAALQETLMLYLGQPVPPIKLVSCPGQAIEVCGPYSHLQLSLSHMPAISVAAIRRCGAIGVDVMQVDPSVEAMAEWERVALDYLGPAVTNSLRRAPAAQRPVIFSQAWTRLEASLKCLGLPLVEWTPALARQLATCRLKTLTLPENCCGVVAIKL